METVVLEAMTQEPRKSHEMDVSGPPEAAPERGIPVTMLCEGDCQEGGKLDEPRKKPGKDGVSAGV